MSGPSRPSLSEISARGSVKPAKLAHVVLRSAQPARVRAWYLTVLDGRVAYENDLVCFITYDDEHHRIGIVKPPGLSDPADTAPGLEHIAFTYGSLGELLATYRRLKAAGIEPFWTINHGPTISMYYRDPDRNKVELQVDVFATLEATNAFLDRYYPENFMGIIFDPEEMIRRYEAGVPLEQIYERPALPPGQTPWDMFRP